MDNGVWILGEQTDGRLEPVSFELCRWGRALADELGVELSVVLPAGAIDDDEVRRLFTRGADRTYVIEHPALARFLPEPYQRVLVDLVGEHAPEILLAAATTTGRTLMPYAAARLEVGLTADCTELSIDPETRALLQTRPAIGGNIMATIRSNDRRPQMATVRPHSAPPADEIPGRDGKIVRITPPEHRLASRIEVEEVITLGDNDADLKAAEVVVSAGRGIGRAENLEMVRELAERLGAAVGASREVIDRGWIGYPHQVGLSGKTIRPRVYVALGISGAIQHLAGMQTSEHIIAICRDADAPIFQVADLGIVGDLFQIIPPLIERLREESAP